MGADCGTAILDGVGVGFANAVERGPVGIVGASGTGIQEVSCLLDAAGIGISHAIGVGGRDLSAEVGGLMIRRGLELLAADEDTRAIVAISKPPDPAVAAAIEEVAAAAGKPVVLGFDLTLEQAAARAAELVGGALPAFGEALRRPPVAGRVSVGLYSGGTLCAEARRIVGGGEFTDFGADEYTRGRAHPMIDPSLRLDRLVAAGRDPTSRCSCSTSCSATAPIPTRPASWRRRIEGLDQHVIVALCGAAGDPQGLDAQRERLEAAGAVVTRSNAHAARLAGGRPPVADISGGPLAVANAGVELFADELERQGVPVERVEWRPPEPGTEDALAAAGAGGGGDRGRQRRGGGAAGSGAAGALRGRRRP